ncbi:hypothetical protein MANES_13G095400v8 [Manihot esculenta]|uniref:Uncharacterized protein n=1 Tax=Manihot esculenta TaxID=3983 RepID=A0A2C9URQ6_MANES|nr:hypothetical protein MANES_13G095400v8 [Manihot esculenta]
MTTLQHSSLTTTCIVIAALLCLLLLLPPASSFHQQLARGFLFEDKTRLGSRPPSCHNKCNGCHPCMAVQVPTVPSPTGFSQRSEVFAHISFTFRL